MLEGLFVPSHGSGRTLAVLFYWHPRCIRGRFAPELFLRMAWLTVWDAACIVAGKRRSVAVSSAMAVGNLFGEDMKTSRNWPDSRAATRSSEDTIALSGVLLALHSWRVRRKRHERAKPDKIGHSSREALFSGLPDSHPC